MSGYRNYVPWKSTIPTTSYKSGTGSTYSSRDDISATDSKTTRFGSIASPAAYRPSYSGGTYRSVPIKKATAQITTTAALLSRYPSTTTTASTAGAKNEKETSSAADAKKTQSTQHKYVGSSSNKENSGDQKISRYSTSTGNLSKYGRKSRDPSPATSSSERRSTVGISKVKSRETSPARTSLRTRTREPVESAANRTLLRTRSRDLRDPSPGTTSTLLRTRSKDLREPSPASTSLLRSRSRDPREPSPASSLLRGRSRDPSPAETTLRDRITTAATNFKNTSYRLFPRNSTQQSSKYGSNTALSRTSGLADKALSYMSSSDVRAAAKTASKHRERREKAEKSSSKDTEPESSDLSSAVTTSKTTDPKSSSITESSSAEGATESKESQDSVESKQPTEINEAKESSSETSEESEEPEVMISVTVVTRSTSPTPPGVRSRRSDLAKTLEKTIQRSAKKPASMDKEIQSDRMDDPTRYSRFSGASRISTIPYTSSYLDNKFSGNSRYSGSSSSSKTSKDSSSRSEVENPDKKKKDEPLPLSKSSSGVSKSSSTKSLTKEKDKDKDKSKSSTESKSKSKSQKSADGSTQTTTSSRSLPPTVPKAESPTKSIGTSTGSTSKLPNKDFRKSALNVGPTDRPRKSRTPSTGTDSEENREPSKIPTNVNNAASGGQFMQRCERSPSVGSEASGVSGTTATSSSSEDDSKRCQQPNNLTSSGAKNLASSENSSMPDNISSGYNKIISSCSGKSVSGSKVDSGDAGTGAGSGTSGGIQSKQQTQTKKKSPADSSRVSKTDEAKSFLIRKLGSVSNFFVNRSQDTTGEPIYLDKTSSSPSTSDGLKQDASINQSVSEYLPVTTATSNSRTETDPDESSWWQNTSQQVDTESALDLCDDMKYKLRHIDSGELAWWMQNDEDDTIAGDIKTLNQDEVDRSENNTDRSLSRELNSNAASEQTWWPKTDKSSSRGKYENRQSESGERNWWQSDSTNELAKETSEVNGNNSASKQYKISHIRSGERAWWLSENSHDSAKEEKDVNSAKISPAPAPAQSQYKITHVKSGEKAWWMSSNSDIKNSPQRDSSSHSLSAGKKGYRIKKIESGERAWWLQEESPGKREQNIEEEDEGKRESELSEDEEINHVVINHNARSNQQSYRNSLELPPLGDRASPEGLEDTTIRGRKSPYDNIPNTKVREERNQKLFISRHRNIDELLGGSCRPLSPTLDQYASKNVFLEEITPAQVRIHDSTPQFILIQRMERDPWDYSSVSPSRSMPQYEQPPPQQQHQHQQKVLDDAALQVYKDGDYGAYLDLESSLAEQAEEIEGLNLSRKNSIVVRTQLSVRVHAIIEKLLSSEGSELRRALFSLKQIFQEDKDLVHGFVALGGLNCLVRVGNGADQNYQNYILRALGQVMLYVDGMNGVMKHGPTIQWLYSLIASKYRLVVKTALKLLLVFVEYVESNCYLLVNAIHTVDKAQGTLPWSNIMKLLKDYDNADTELLIYATSLINKTLSGLSDQDSFYDESDYLEQQGIEGVIQRYMSRQGTDLDLLDQLQLYEAVLKFEDGETDGIRIPDNTIRKTLRYRSTDSTERRKSRRHSTGTSPSMTQNMSPSKRYTPSAHQGIDEDSSSSNNSNEFSGGVFRECKGQREGAGVTPGLRRRRERAERQKTFMREQQEAVANGMRSPFEKKDELNGLESDNEDKKLLLQLKRDHTVKDLTQKLSNLPMSPQEDKPQNRIGDMTGLISKAKEGLAKSKSKGEISRSPSVDQELRKSEPKKSENELHWEELVKSMTRPLILCDLDFTDLNLEDEKDVLAPRSLGGSVPPPPPPIGIPPPISGMGIPPPFMGGGPPPINFPPPPTNLVPPPGFNFNTANKMNGDLGTSTIKKNKKTVKLFWKEVREDLIPPSVGKTIWDELPTTNVDTQKLEHLFESRAKDLMAKKQQELNKSKEIIVLDHKRSNAINIAMTKLPPPRAIKAAILKMDATVVTREGIDKLLNMLPTEEERGKIQEAQMSNPELPLGSAEQFLLTLSSISELAARLKLWAFKLDFENSEKEIAEPLNDLKQGLELLKANRTFKCILSTLLSVGIFLNGAPVKGFQIEYLAKVPEVKDTVHKHSLLHHLCHMVNETSPDTTDLYSEIGPITRASKADFQELAHNLIYLETECKASWDRLKLIAKHDCPTQLKQKLVDFLADCAERIIILEIVHRRVINRYRKFLLWLGVPQHRIAESRPNEFCRILSEFALEYRTTRERVQQQIEKKANHRERNKTRGKMIIDVAKFRTQEDRADAELKQLLGSPSPGNETLDGTLTWRRRRAENLRSPIIKQNEENFTDGDDEILESLVKTATKAPGSRPTPRERKRTRNADRKSLKRSRTREGFTVERIAASPEH